MVRKRWYQWMIEPLRNYARIANRASRAELWWFTLFEMCLYFLATILDAVFGWHRHRDGPIVSIVWLVLLMPQLGVGIRRLHDVNRSGWWYAAPIAAVAVALFLATVGASQISRMPSLGDILLVLTFIGISVPFTITFVWQFVDGTRGPNRFGPDPKGR